MARDENARRARRPSRRPVVLIFGENTHDSGSLRTLVEYLHPTLVRHCDVSVRKDPPSLTRSASPSTSRNWLDQIAQLVRLEERMRTVRGVLVHQDADGPDAQGAARGALQAQLDTLVTSAPAHAIVPVQETEGWWFLFPEAVRAVKPGAWRQLVLRAGDTAMIPSPKEELKRATRKVAPKHEYDESDSIAIAEQIAVRRLAPVGHNHSWDSFVTIATGL